MPAIQFGLSSYERGRGDLPELPVINLYAEEAPTEAGQVVLQSRPGLADRGADMGSGPVKALFQRDLVLNSDLFGVSGSSLYRGTTAIGSVNGDGPFSIAGYENFLFVAGGSNLSGYDGTTLAVISFPDNASVSKVIVGASRAICIRKDTGKFYWSDALESDIEALDFATAENSPDRLLDCLFIGDVLYLFGGETVETWPNTQDSDLPFQPLEHAVIKKGIKATGCATAIGRTFAWVTNDNQVCLGNEARKISNPGLSKRIAESSECSLFAFTLEGTEFLGLRIDGETQAINLDTMLWGEFQSYGEPNWIPQCFANGVFGSSVDGRTLAWSSGHLDYHAPEGEHERRFRAGFRPDGPGNISNIRLDCNVGQAVDLSGDFASPEIELRFSRDHGKTWSSWRRIGLGEQGEYGRIVETRNLGMTKRGFGWICEYRLTAPIDFRASSVKVNESLGGL